MPRTLGPTASPKIAGMPSVSAVDPNAPINADAVVVGVVAGERGPRLAPGAKPVEALLGRQLTAALRALGATGAADEVLRIPTLGLAPFPLVIATGLGEDPRSAESLRRAVGAALRAIGGQSNVHVAIDGPVGALAEGAVLGSYRYTAYKSNASRAALRKITLAAADDRSELRRARVVTEAIVRTRDLVNTPPNDLYPATFAAARTAGWTAHMLEQLAHNRLIRPSVDYVGPMPQDAKAPAGAR